MPAISVPNRPFASETITGLALPDGIFETTIGAQRINAHFKNQGASAAGAVRIYVESTSDPGITITPQTFTVGLGGGAAQLLRWDADFASATPGIQYVSFVVDDGASRAHIIKKIFVTQVTFNPVTRTFGAVTPEGRLEIGFNSLTGPKGACCCGGKRTAGREGSKRFSILELARIYAGRHDPEFHLCLPGYLITDVDLAVTPTPPYPGQYGDLPCQDPWWKIILCLVALLLLIAAAIAEALDGSGDITVSGGTGGGDGGQQDCCGVQAQGGGTSYVAAGLVAAAATVATVAAASDVRDPFRRGEDHTNPGPGELTMGEKVNLKIGYPEPVALGRPFAVKADWTYERITTGGSYTYAVSETNTNVHVVSKYEIDAADIARLYRREPWIVRARFFDGDGKAFRGEQLFVQCFLAGPAGQYRSFLLQDGGTAPDEKPNDGVYTGVYQFAFEEQNPRGLWTFFVIAQDVNAAQPNMKPEEAAQLIGGLVVSQQLTIDFTGGTCPLVADGHVNVI
jgi:hypothetical protein